MCMGFAPTWLRQVSPPPLLHKTTLTTECRYIFFGQRWSSQRPKFTQSVILPYKAQFRRLKLTLDRCVPPAVSNQRNYTAPYAAAQCIVIAPVPVCVFVCVWMWVCYHDNSKLRASILTKLGLVRIDARTMISSWLNFGRPAPPGRGSAAGRKNLLQPARSVCVASERFFILYCAPEKSDSKHRPRALATLIDLNKCCTCSSVKCKLHRNR